MIALASACKGKADLLAAWRDIAGRDFPARRQVELTRLERRWKHILRMVVRRYQEESDECSRMDFAMAKYGFPSKDF